MKKHMVIKLIICLSFLNINLKLLADNEFGFYLNDFHEKKTIANKILKSIEIDLKNGSREKVCKRQIEAANLILMAHESLLKAYEINNSVPPMDLINKSKLRWEGILKDCN